MDPGIAVPPKGYGGHERLVYMFARQYQKLGHKVDLLVSPGSAVEGCVVYSFGQDGFPPKKWNALKAIPQAWLFLWKHRNNYDMIHNFGRLLFLLPVLNHKVNKIMTYGREIDSSNIRKIVKLPHKNLVFTAPSDDCVSTGSVAGKWVTVYNAIDFSKYTPSYSVEPDAPLIFLSRLDRVKGCHIAIEVAKSTNNKLIIAGNISTIPSEFEYFKNEIEPHIDGEQIIYVGTVNDEEKNFYLRQSKAMLFPIDIREAFGMVMAESMACGTPVIGFGCGAVPEVIENEISGYVVPTKEEMVGALAKIEQIDRKGCAKRARERFDVSVITEKYLKLVSYV
ncbi:glycosyltransferase involved in cell wall biosynthesis [Pontibacter aydingkolensis]|uniref:Glycosyltransferase n=2 Tax=Pontibacter aydingkolensis TaxID=1911536 RepID=A0ABS7CTN6_9BACT|nr:glycosyltransferase [Pontibacter aydingkolensis]